jgi:peptidoglycan/xylan/chitin deacetylase (PgdA/CDA1 family)
MSLWVKTNRFIKTIFPNYVWDIPNTNKKVYLTFDDGPIPEITEWVLNQLNEFDAKATFFCIGDNIEKHPEIFKKIIENDHAVGNHTYNHLKGWETTQSTYIDNTEKCSETMTNLNNQTKNTKLFRPPYGKIKPSQAKTLRKLGYRIIMWDIISMDFDQKTSPEKCLDNVLKNIESGSIVVFHDSIKARQNLLYVLPKTLAFLKKNDFVCEKIS